METSQEKTPAKGSVSSDPPTNEEGQYICSRACTDGSPCLAIVPLPYFACYQHARNEPMIDAETQSTDSID